MFKTIAQTRLAVLVIGINVSHRTLVAGAEWRLLVRCRVGNSGSEAPCWNVLLLDIFQSVLSGNGRRL